MRIAVNLLNYTPELAGNGTFARRMLGQLQRLDKTNEYELFLRDIPGIVRTFDVVGSNFRTRKVALGGNRLERILYEQVRLGRTIEHGHYDLLYCPSLAVPLALRNTPVINTIHDLTPMVVRKYGPLRHRYYVGMARRTTSRVDRIVTVSENSKRDIQRFLGVSPERIRVVYNFLDEGYSRHQAAPNKWGRYFLFVGTIQPGKNIGRLISAFDEYVKQSNDSSAKLVVAGKLGWHYQDVILKAKEVDVADRILFTGYVSEFELRDLYTHALALVYPTLYEGFGIPPLEAMTLGTPVVASDVASIPEVVGDAALLVDPLESRSIAAAMCKIVDESTVASLRPKLKHQASRFDGSREAQKLLQLFSEVAEPK